MGHVQETENQLHPAAETYRRVLQLAGDPPQTAAREAHLGLAPYLLRMERPGCRRAARAQSLQLARQIENIDSFAHR